MIALFDALELAPQVIQTLSPSKSLVALEEEDAILAVAWARDAASLSRSSSRRLMQRARMFNKM
jgi:hypothetical protein